MITDSDLRKILDAIAKYGKKDSQLQKARTPLTGQEYVSIIQDGINKIVTFGDVYESLDFPFGFEIVEDHTAIENPDPKKVYREQGENQYTDYMYQDDTWEKLAEFNFPGIDSKPIEGSKNLVESDGIFQFKNSIFEENRQMINSIMENYKPIEIYGDVNNAADEEDVTSVNVSGTDVLKFKDKSYNSLLFSGLGKTNLRKNIQEVIVGEVTTTKNIFTQSMMNEANTIYKIQYDYDLNGATITVPANCTLEFEGGSLSNGIIILDNTQLLNRVRLDVTLSGTIGNETIFAYWFSSDTSLFSTLNSLDGYSTITLQNGQNYNLGTSIVLKPKSFKLIGNGATINSTITSGELIKNTTRSNMLELPIIKAETGSNSIYINDVTGLEAGDLIILRDKTDYSWLESRNYYKQGEYLTINEIKTEDNAYVIKTVENILGEYDNINHSNNLCINKCDYGNITIENLNISSLNSDSATNSIHALHIYTVKNLSINNVNINNFHYSLEVSGIFGGEISNCKIVNKNYRFSGQDNYAIVIGNSQNLRVYNCQCVAKNHGISLGGSNEWYNIVNRFIYIDNCSVQQSDYTPMSFDCHGNSEYIHWSNCKGVGISCCGAKSFIDNCLLYPALSSYGGVNDRQAISFRGERKDYNINVTNCTIIGNLFNTSNTDTVYESSKWGEILIKNNKITFTQNDNNLVLMALATAYSSNDISITIENNILLRKDSQETINAGVSIVSGCLQKVIKNNRCRGVGFVFQGAARNIIFEDNYLEDCRLYCGDSSTLNSLISISDNEFIIQETTPISGYLIDLQSSLSYKQLFIFENNIIFNKNTDFNSGYIVRGANIDRMIYSRNKFASVIYNSNLAEFMITHTINELYIDACFSDLYKDSYNRTTLALNNAKRIILTTVPNTGSSLASRGSNQNIIIKDIDKTAYDTLFDTGKIYGMENWPFVSFRSGKPVFWNGTEWVDADGNAVS